MSELPGLCAAPPPQVRCYCGLSILRGAQRRGRETAGILLSVRLCQFPVPDGRAAPITEGLPRLLNQSEVKIVPFIQRSEPVVSLRFFPASVRGLPKEKQSHAGFTPPPGHGFSPVAPHPHRAPLRASARRPAHPPGLPTAGAESILSLALPRLAGLGRILAGDRDHRSGSPLPLVPIGGTNPIRTARMELVGKHYGNSVSILESN